MKKVVEYGIVIILLLPLLFINIKSSHDWGDDFAQYIHQGKNVVEHVSQNETGYIFNDKCFIGPPAYPVGFPLLLSPVIAFNGIDIVSFNVLISFFLVLTGFVGFLIVRLYGSYLTALIAVLIVVYNPVMLSFKTEIVSDIPYTFFSLLCVYLFHKKETTALSIIIGVLIGFTIHIRSIGFIVLFTYILYRLFTKGFNLKHNTQLLFTVVSFAVVYVLIKFALPYNANYGSVFSMDNLWLNVNDNASYNASVLLNFFKDFENKNFYYIGIISSASLVVFSIFGFLYFIKERIKVPIVIYVIGYMCVILIFQLSDAGLRFLIPILFLIVVFAIEGLKKSITPLIKNTKWLPLVIGFLLLFSYKDEIIKIKERETSVLEGPQTDNAQQVFKFIDNALDKKSIIAFDKARALALYTHHPSVAISSDISDELIKQQLKAFKVNYLLIHNTISAQNLALFSKTDTTLLKNVFSNQDFKLYKIRNTSFN